MPDTVNLRLLICAVCKSIEELPWFEGPAEHDDTKNYKLSFHRFPSGNQHPFAIGDVIEAEWNNPTKRELILKAITQNVDGIGEAGLGAEFYDLKANFQADAFTCWSVTHNRTTDCADYKTDRMRLLPDTRAERKAQGLTTRRPNTFLCDFCPYKSVVQKTVFKKRGLDK